MEKTTTTFLVKCLRAFIEYNSQSHEIDAKSQIWHVRLQVTTGVQIVVLLCPENDIFICIYSVGSFG